MWRKRRRHTGLLVCNSQETISFALTFRSTLAIICLLRIALSFPASHALLLSFDDFNGVLSGLQVCMFCHGLPREATNSTDFNQIARENEAHDKSEHRSG